MTQETLNRANELARKIEKAKQDVLCLQEIDTSVGSYIGIGKNGGMHVDSVLLKKIINLVVTYKNMQITDMNDEFLDL